MLGLLLVGDLFAIWLYRHHVDWLILRRLVPPVLIGLLCGVLIVWLLNGEQLRRLIGVILLLLTAGTLILLGSTRHDAQSFSRSTPTRWFYGGLGGFTTMVANAGGPPMTLYFVASGMDMVRFLGTQAYFFFAVNLMKIPFQYSLGLYSATSLSTALVLLAPLLLGIAIGRVFIRSIKPEIFTPLIVSPPSCRRCTCLCDDPLFSFSAPCAAMACSTRAFAGFLFSDSDARHRVLPVAGIAFHHPVESITGDYKKACIWGGLPPTDHS